MKKYLSSIFLKNLLLSGHIKRVWIRSCGIVKMSVISNVIYLIGSQQKCHLSFILIYTK